MRQKNLKIVLLCVIGGLAMILIAVITMLCLLRFSNGRKFDDQISLGDKYLQEMNYEDAELAYLEAISINRKDQKGYVKLANLYITTGELEEAKDVLKTGMRYAQKTDELEGLYQAVKLQTEEIEESVKESSKATEISGEKMKFRAKDQWEARYAEDRQTLLVYAQFTENVLENGNEALQKSLNQWNEEKKQLIESRLDDMEVWNTQKLERVGKDNFYAQDVWNNAILKRSDEKVLSFVECIRYYQNDNWQNDFYGFTYNAQTGQVLNYEDIVIDQQGFFETAAEYCVRDLRICYPNIEFKSNYEEKVYEMLESPEVWYLDASGFGFIFDAEILTNSYLTQVEAHVPYEMVADFIMQEYVWEDSPGVAALSLYHSAYVSVNGEKKLLTADAEESFYEAHYSFTLDGAYADWGAYVEFGNIYILNQGECQYLIADSDIASADYETSLYQFTDNALILRDTIYGNIDSGNVGAESFSLEFKVDVLGSYSSRKEFYVDKEQRFKTDEERFEFAYDNPNFAVLTTTRQIPVVIDGQQVKLPSGTRLKLLSTNETSDARILILDTNQEATLYFEKDSEGWKYLIDGNSEYDCFEMLPYAG